MLWSSSRFSRHSTDQTCQPFARATTLFASGRKYAALAEVPGLRTSTFLARRGPTSSTPTRLYLAGVPGDAWPWMRVKRTEGLAAAGAAEARTARSATSPPWVRCPIIAGTLACSSSPAGSQETHSIRDDGVLMSESPDAHRVLVVDDEPNIVDVVAMALRFQGFAVESAGTGADAVAKVSSFKPQLIVLDVMLPDMEGFDVAKRLGAQRARVPIIYLTARDATEDKIRGLALGGDDYVTKPFSLEELVARIRSILRRSGLAEPESSRLVFEDLELD